MQCTAVDSSSLRRVGYAEDARQLEVEFDGGALYRYYDVPPRVYAELLAAPSKGSWFNREFKALALRTSASTDPLRERRIHSANPEPRGSLRSPD